jgi:Putative prokaryotic signal transducing protein
MPEPDVRLVPVFQTGDAALIAIAKSLLDAEGIEYHVRGEEVQDLFAWGRFGFGFNPITGAPVFIVREDDAERARQLLHGLKTSAEDD